MSKTISSRQPVSSRATATKGIAGRTATARRGAPNMRPFHMPFENQNIIVILVGVVTIGLGYLLMAMSEPMGAMALTVAPIILCLGYLVVIPYGIMYGARTYKNRNADSETIKTDPTA